MSGLQGRFFAPLGVAFILATLASLGIALTVTPALCYFMLSRTQPHAELRYVSALKLWHRRALQSISVRPRAIIVGAALLSVGALATLPFFGGELLPDFREGHFVIGVSATPGTSLNETL